MYGMKDTSISLIKKKAIPSSITNFQKNITRGEMAEMIYRLKEKITNKASNSYEKLLGKPPVRAIPCGCP